MPLWRAAGLCAVQPLSDSGRTTTGEQAPAARPRHSLAAKRAWRTSKLCPDGSRVCRCLRQRSGSGFLVHPFWAIEVVEQRAKPPERTASAAALDALCAADGASALAPALAARSSPDGHWAQSKTESETGSAQGAKLDGIPLTRTESKLKQQTATETRSAAALGTRWPARMTQRGRGLCTSHVGQPFAVSEVVVSEPPEPW